MNDRTTVLRNLETAINAGKYKLSLTLFRQLDTLGGVDYSNFDELLLAGRVGECTLAYFLQQKGHEIQSFSPDKSFKAYDILTSRNGKDYTFEVKLDNAKTKNAWITYEYDGLPDGILQPELTAAFWAQVRPTSNKLLISRVDKLQKYCLNAIENHPNQLKEKKWYKSGRVIVEKGVLIPEDSWKSVSQRGVFPIE